MWVFLCILSAVFFALNHIVSKEFSIRENITKFFPLFYLFSFFLLLPFITWLQVIPNLQVLITLSLFSLFTILGTFFLFYAYSKTAISTSGPLLNFSPIILFITSFFILGERASGISVIGVIFIIVGGYLISLKNVREWYYPFTSLPIKYFGIVLLTLFFWSLAAPLAKLTLKEMNVYSFTLYTMLFGFFVWFIIEKIRGVSIICLFKRHWKISLYGAFFYLGAEIAFFMALSIPEVFVSLAIPIKRTSSLFVVLMGGKFFHEKNIGQKLIACAIMLSGVFLIAQF
ncbi:MAG: EamA family transporter [Nanoarchaeota archaeon]